MSAFIDNHYNAITMTLSNMYDRHVSFEKSPLTHDDLMHLIIQPSDYDVVQRAASMFERYSFISESAALRGELSPGGKTFEAHVSMAGAVSFIMPKYAKRIVDNAPSELIEKFVTYIRERHELSRQYGRVREVLRQLVQLCESPSQVKFLWPAIELIVNQIKDEDLRKRLHNKLTANSRKSLPIVPPALRSACRETATTLAMWQMLPAGPAGQAATNVRLPPIRYDDELGTYAGM